MALEARASKTVFKKNLIIVAMCAVFMFWFAYDGWIRWPARNDLAVAAMREMINQTPPKFVPGAADYLPRWRIALDEWKSWGEATAEQRKEMNDIASIAKQSGPETVQNWKSPLDISFQRWIVVGLVAATAAAVWWVIHCQKRRVIADDQTVSPAEGVVIPWEKITLVDNTRWNSAGLVDITYLDDNGQPHKALFDDYVVERAPLLEILDLLAEKAQKAEFIPKEEVAPPTPSAGEAGQIGEASEGGK